MRAGGAAPGIEVAGLSKRFGAVRAITDLEFRVEPGRITGFLGPNGAGKTTTLRILLGLVDATAGRATIGGRRYRQIPRPLHEVGALLESTSFHPARRARDHLRVVARAGRIDRSRVGAVLELVGLREVAKRRVGGFSMGMRQRLGLATALLGDPGVLVLDEPANGLDPQGMAWLRELLRYFANEGRTVLVSSHLLAEMSQTIDDVVIISEGRLRATGPLSTLTGQVRSSVRVRTPDAERLVDLLRPRFGAIRRLASDLISVEGASPEQIGPLLAEHRIVIYELVSQQTDLESVFLSITGSAPGAPGTDAARGQGAQAPPVPATGWTESPPS
ncbi:MAG TPA: ATP-binding cassette domain-containing protein [Acidimicrobiales bacterium]|nr:ATP-binding cassette domain-containing protein [Acidimicrobiales bacterium]